MADWLPEEFAIRKYIFDTWRRVCVNFGYQEYLTPVLESAEIYRAKSGEDVGGKELMTMVDQGGRELAIRPEMTPSVTRMVTRIYESAPKPLRLFSIANFVRNEKPQRGRNREFWQLNADVFGSQSYLADVEILQLAIEIMKAFGATEKQFVVLLNHRKVIDAFVRDYVGVPLWKVPAAIRIIDKFSKLPRQEFLDRLATEAEAMVKNPEELIAFMSGDVAATESVMKQLENADGMAELKTIINLLNEQGYGEYFKFWPSLVRGFDYYDGSVFEVFDRDFLARRENNEEVISRSLFGGGRYNGLAELFNGEGKGFPAVGFAPGDETTKLFLEKYDLLTNVVNQPATSRVYVPLLDEKLVAQQLQLITKLRKEFQQVVAGVDVQKFGKALEFADKNGFSDIAILGENEAAEGKYKIKNLQSGEETEAGLTTT
jgi:histidyl-tRNA synthetase